MDQPAPEDSSADSENRITQITQEMATEVLLMARSLRKSGQVLVLDLLQVMVVGGWSSLSSLDSAERKGHRSVPHLCRAHLISPLFSSSSWLGYYSFISYDREDNFAKFGM
jgi:hypothetical protein